MKRKIILNIKIGDYNYLITEYGDMFSEMVITKLVYDTHFWVDNRIVKKNNLINVNEIGNYLVCDLKISSNENVIKEISKLL